MPTAPALAAPVPRSENQPHPRLTGPADRTRKSPDGRAGNIQSLPATPKASLNHHLQPRTASPGRRTNPSLHPTDPLLRAQPLNSKRRLPGGTSERTRVGGREEESVASLSPASAPASSQISSSANTPSHQTTSPRRDSNHMNSQLPKKEVTKNGPPSRVTRL